MNTFNINDEINNLIEKTMELFKKRLIKIVTRSEKLVLKQYIASQKETARATRGSSRTASKPSKKPTKKACSVPRQEKDYRYKDCSSFDNEFD